MWNLRFEGLRWNWWDPLAKAIGKPQTETAEQLKLDHRDEAQVLDGFGREGGRGMLDGLGAGQRQWGTTWYWM